MNFFKKVILGSRDALAVLLLLAVYHAYELLCYIMSNILYYYWAVIVCAGALFLVSLGLIYLHDFFQARFSWDALRLQYLNRLAEENHIPVYHFFKRLTRAVLREGFWAIFFIGPIILGPFIITVLLRKQKTWQTNLLYAASGALLNALFWVAFMRGLGVLTWGHISELGGIRKF